MMQHWSVKLSCANLSTVCSNYSIPVCELWLLLCHYCAFGCVVCNHSCKVIQLHCTQFLKFSLSTVLSLLMCGVKGFLLLKVFFSDDVVVGDVY